MLGKPGAAVAMVHFPLTGGVPFEKGITGPTWSHMIGHRGTGREDPPDPRTPSRTKPCPSGQAA